MKGNVVNSRKHQTSHLCVCQKNLLSYETYAKVKRPNFDRMEKCGAWMSISCVNGFIDMEREEFAYPFFFFMALKE